MEQGNFNQPVDLTLNNSDDQLFITDCCDYRVQVFTPQGQFLESSHQLLKAHINKRGGLCIPVEY